ncbi:unnamed protein product [Symbiodinium sp. KB8]|nr:unnamed protein product [Symbiodinium sp. KB8]
MSTVREQIKWATSQRGTFAIARSTTDCDHGEGDPMIRRVLILMAMLFGGIVIMAPQAASAHTPTVAPSCSGLSVELKWYEHHADGATLGSYINNRVTVTINGVPESFDFPGYWAQDFTWSATQDNTWSVVIDANLYTGHPTAYDTEFSGTQEWNDQLPPDSPDCQPDVTITVICAELSVADEFETYWYEVTNNEDVTLEVTWAGGSAVLDPGASQTVSADQNGVAISVNGEVVATADSLDTGSTDPAANDDICQIDVEFTKDVEGPGPDADTLYTIKVSRLTVDGEVAEFEEEVTFDLLDNESKVVPLPSTMNPLGIEYKIEEIADGGASLSAVNPNSFVLDGHRGETISVVVINSFASVEIEKDSSATTVFEGDELNYSLDVTNTGVLTLDPVVVDDLLPAGVTYVDYEIEGDAGSCTLTQAAKPQLVTCTFDDALAPGAEAPGITLLVTVDSIDPGEQIVNQARVRGTYEAPEVNGNANFLDEAAGLTCEPTEGEVCDMSPRAGVTGGTPTTTSTASGSPTTTVVGSNSATTTIAAELPPTGSNGTNTMVWIGALLLGAGAAISLLVRRQAA